MNHTTWQDRQTSATIESDHHRFDITYQDFGSGDPVTVFLHGIPTWGFLFRDVYDGVSRAIIPDLPGYGYTRKVNPGGFDRSVRAQASYLHALLDELGVDSVQLVGHDIGGTVAARVAAHSDRVDRLVLSNTPLYDSWPIDLFAELGLPQRARNMTYKEVESLLRTLFSDGLYNDEQATDTFLDGMIAPFLDRNVADLSRNAIATNTNHSLELVPYYSNIDCPLLLLWGVPGSQQHIGYLDRFIEAVGTQEITRTYLDQSYHWVMQERPDRFREELTAFLL